MASKIPAAALENPSSGFGREVVLLWVNDSDILYVY